MERGQEAWLIALTTNAKETDHRRRGLPRPRCKRPRHRSATKNTKEIPPSHVSPLVQETASYRLMRVL